MAVVGAERLAAGAGKPERTTPIVGAADMPEGRSAVPVPPITDVLLRLYLPLLARVGGGGGW